MESAYDNQRCHACNKEAYSKLSHCGHGYCPSCVETLKNNPDPVCNTDYCEKSLQCTFLNCKTHISEKILEICLKLVQCRKKEVALNGLDIDHQKGDVSRSNIAECSSTRSQKEQEHTSCKEGYILREQTEITPTIMALNGLDIDHQIGGVSRSNIAECSSTRSQKEQEHTSCKEGDTLREQTEITPTIMALNGLDIDHQTRGVSRSNITECSSTRSQKEQEHTSSKEGDTLREQTEITPTITISNVENALCELCNDLAVAVIGYCFHQYCLGCISVLLNSLSSDEKSFRCVAKNCETLICKRRIEQFSMTPMVKQKEMSMYFEVKPNDCGIRECLNQGIINARYCNHSFCLECLQNCTPGKKCKGTTCQSLNLPSTHHFDMLITSLLNKTDTEIFPFVYTQNESKHIKDDWICLCRSKGCLKIVRCGHIMCNKCYRDNILPVKLVYKQKKQTGIGRCNVSDCQKFFIAPFYGALKNQKETRKIESKINQASNYSKRQNETETQDGDNAGAIAKLQQTTSSHSAGTKKKRKLKKDHDVRDKVEKTRTLYRRHNTRGMKAESLGLRNVGLSCYRNCILQVLAETPNFCDLLGRFLNSSLKEKQTTWIRYLHTVLVGIETKSTEDHIEELYQFHHEFNRSNPGFKEYVQEDCLSFLTTLLNGIQEVLQEKRGTSINPTGLFRGKWKDIYTCLKCSTKEHYNESQFYYLPLPYKEKKNKKATIGSCLVGLLEEEYLDFFTCSKCGDACMSKELAIEIFPTILVLQFSKPSEGDESNQDRYLGKKDKFVKFWDHFDGLTNTELKKKIGKHTLTPYRLFGVVEHWGSESSGHYISFVKRKDKQNWQRCDDSYVCDIGLDSVLESNAYLLFYERCETQIE